MLLDVEIPKVAVIVDHNDVRTFSGSSSGAIPRPTDIRKHATKHRSHSAICLLDVEQLVSYDTGLCSCRSYQCRNCRLCFRSYDLLVRGARNRMSRINREPSRTSAPF